MMIYKILRPREWTQFRSAGQTHGAPVDLTDGFVHFSTAAQLGETLRRHFSHEGDLILLACSAKDLGNDLRWEPSRGGDLFPHLYRPLGLDDIAWFRDMPRTPHGHDTGPLE